MKYSIFDLDNCLRDDSRRFPLIDWHLTGDDRWRRYNADAINDVAHHGSYLKVLSSFTTPVVFTNVNVAFEDITRAWLWQAHGFKGLLRMRPPGLRISPEAAKEQMLNELFSNGKKEVVVAFDDHPPILEMYRKHGIPAVQLKVHDINIYGDRPATLL